MNDEGYELLGHLIGRILDNAEEALADYKKDPNEFDSGRKFAYFEVLDSLKNDLMCYDLDLDRLGANYDPYVYSR